MQLVDKKQTISRFEEVFKQMWINNGNEISKMYAGTGAIQGGSKVTKNPQINPSISNTIIFTVNGRSSFSCTNYSK